MILFFEAALGSWDLKIYSEPLTSDYNKKPHINEFVMEFGHIYNMIFLLINLVLMLNLVIAILSNTFAAYSELSNGLYYKVLVNIFPLYEYHDEYGCLTCGQSPFNLILIIVWPIMYLCEKCKPDGGVARANRYFTSILYIPSAIVFTSVFTIFNVLILPVAYLY